MRVAARLIVVWMLSLPAVASGPASDCGPQEDEIGKLVCSDSELAALDQRMDAFYKEAVLQSDDRPTLVADQRGWLQLRDECAARPAPRACVANSYRNRIAELQIRNGLVMAPKAVEFTCEDDTQPFTVAFYNDIDPPAAVLTWGDDQAIALQAPAASGIHYATRGVDYREHQGEATVDFHGHTLKCRPLR